MPSLFGSTQTPRKPSVRIYRATEILDLPKPDNPCWIGPSILPKSSKLLFGGGAKIGKSMLMLSLGRALAFGEHRPLGCPFFECNAPQKVLIIEQELKLYGTKVRLDDLYKTATSAEREALHENLHIVTGEPKMQVSTEEGRQEIAACVEEIKPAVLFFDPIGKMMTGWDENRAEQMSQLWYHIDCLMKQGESWGMSMIISHHFGKPPRNDKDREGYDGLDPYNFRGSAKFKEDPDTLATVENKGPMSKPWKAWYIHTRWETRQGEPPPGDLRFSINRDDDLRVHYEGLVGTQSARLTPELPKKEKMAPAKEKKPSGLLHFVPAAKELPHS